MQYNFSRDEDREGPPEIETQNGEKVCDYDTSATLLYELLESSSWERARSRCRSHSDEVRTWICRSDKNGVRWRLLPLHAAIIFQSPNFLVSALLEQFPAAASSADDQGMLPLHLAFRHKQEDEDLLELLLLSYPKAVMIRDKRDRVPLEHGRDSKFSAKIMRLYADATVAASRQSSKEHQTIDSPTARTATTTRTGGRDIRAIEIEHQKAMEKLKEEYESEIRRLESNDHRAQEKIESAESKISDLRAEHQNQLKELRDTYERRISILYENHSAEIRKIENNHEQERHAIEKTHKQELNELRDLLTKQVHNDRELSDSLEKEIAHLQVALQERKADSDRQMVQFKMLEASNQKLQILLQTVHKQQAIFHQLLTQQQDDIEASKSVRSQLIQTLIRQDESDKERSQCVKLLNMVETLRRQVDQALEQPSFIRDERIGNSCSREIPFLNTTGRDQTHRDRLENESRPPGRLERAREDKASVHHQSHTHHQSWNHRALPKEQRDVGEYGEVKLLADEISAITDTSDY
jgi:hypothetical protein